MASLTPLRRLCEIATSQNNVIYNYRLLQLQDSLVFTGTSFHICDLSRYFTVDCYWPAYT